MRTVETKIFTFNELSESAKEVAREWWRQCENEDSSSQEFVYDDAAAIAELFGLDIRTRPVKLMGGWTRYDPCIYYSGFSSQGDGACFEGTYRYRKGALKAVKEYAPQDETLHGIVAQLQALQKRNFYRVVCTTKHSGHYYHSGCMRVDCENSHDSYLPVVDEDGFVDCLRNFADWIYDRLEAEYDWTMADEQVDDSIIANEYEFTENGDIY
jgi:hypothetical protein